MADTRRDSPPVHPDEPPLGEDQPTPDVVPDDAPRGGQSVPMPANDTGGMTAPVSGWGETVEGEDLDPQTEADER